MSQVWENVPVKSYIDAKGVGGSIMLSAESVCNSDTLIHNTYMYVIMQKETITKNYLKASHKGAYKMLVFLFIYFC